MVFHSPFLGEGLQFLHLNSWHTFRIPCVCLRFSFNHLKTCLHYFSVSFPECSISDAFFLCQHFVSFLLVLCYIWFFNWCFNFFVLSFQPWYFTLCCSWGLHGRFNHETCCCSHATSPTKQLSWFRWEGSTTSSESEFFCRCCIDSYCIALSRIVLH